MCSHSWSCIPCSVSEPSCVVWGCQGLQSLRDALYHCPCVACSPPHTPTTRMHPPGVCSPCIPLHTYPLCSLHTFPLCPPPLHMSPLLRPLHACPLLCPLHTVSLQPCTCPLCPSPYIPVPFACVFPPLHACPLCVVVFLLGHWVQREQGSMNVSRSCDIMVAWPPMLLPSGV